MNKIQLEATLQLAEIDCENNPTPVNKSRVAQARAAFDAFLKAQEPATEAEKPLKPAATKKQSAPAPKKEKVVIPDAIADNTDASAEETDTEPDAIADDAQAEVEETEKKTQE